jgi:hypothetical protein
MVAADVEWGSAIGLGLFVALWGGLGFGAMVGGVVWVTRHEEHGAGQERIDAPVPSPRAKGE